MRISPTQGPTMRCVGEWPRESPEIKVPDGAKDMEGEAVRKWLSYRATSCSDARSLMSKWLRDSGLQDGSSLDLEPSHVSNRASELKSLIPFQQPHGTASQELDQGALAAPHEHQVSWMYANCTLCQAWPSDPRPEPGATHSFPHRAKSKPQIPTKVQQEYEPFLLCGSAHTSPRNKRSNKQDHYQETYASGVAINKNTGDVGLPI